MSTQDPRTKSEPQLGVSDLSANPTTGDSTHAGSALLGEPSRSRPAPTSTPGLSRSNSVSNSSYHDDSEDDTAFFPPVERLTMFDFIENMALTERFDKLQASISNQTA
jgi:hypothetical protein